MSIILNKEHPYYNHFKAAVWLRPNIIFNVDYSSISMFDEIKPNDINQGSLGVCYLLSILSALAEYPERVK